MRRALTLCLLGLFLVSQGLLMLHRHGELGHRHLGYCTTPDHECSVGDRLFPAPLARFVAFQVNQSRILTPLDPVEPSLPVQTRPTADVLARGPPALS